MVWAELLSWARSRRKERSRGHQGLHLTCWKDGALPREMAKAAEGALCRWTVTPPTPASSCPPETSKWDLMGIRVFALVIMLKTSR